MGSSVRRLEDWRAEFDKAWVVRDFDRMRRILAFVQAWS